MAQENHDQDYNQSVLHWMYFLYNFPYNFMDAFDKGIRDHLQSKWDSLYRQHGPTLGMAQFFMELDWERRDQLLDWVRVNYTGYKMKKHERREEEIDRK